MRRLVSVAAIVEPSGYVNANVFAGGDGLLNSECRQRRGDDFSDADGACALAADSIHKRLQLGLMTFVLRPARFGFVSSSVTNQFELTKVFERGDRAAAENLDSFFRI